MQRGGISHNRNMRKIANDCGVGLQHRQLVEAGSCTQRIDNAYHDQGVVCNEFV